MKVIINIRTLSVLIVAMFVKEIASLAAANKNAINRIAVFGGTGYVGSRVCKRLIKKGYAVTAVSRRGVNPLPKDAVLNKVKWVKGDATNAQFVDDVVEDCDGAVHVIGLLFDVDSGLSGLNKIVSGSGSLPGESSTYDAITRKTMFNLVEAMERRAQDKLSREGSYPRKTTLKHIDVPLCFVSAAEAGWPEVTFGQTMDNLSPGWLKKYLAAKRSVEERLAKARGIRPVVFRPSLIWDWRKFDVLPVIPVFNLASAIGIPFVDKTVRVETLADAIVEAIEDRTVSGVQRYMQMEELAKRNKKLQNNFNKIQNPTSVSRR